MIERHAVHVITEYAKWAEAEADDDASSSPFKGLNDPAVLHQTGLFACWTPDQMVAKPAGALIASRCNCSDRAGRILWAR